MTLLYGTAEMGGAKEGGMDLLGLEYFKVLDALWIREIPDFLPHSLTEQGICFGDRATEDDYRGIVGVHDHLDKFADMPAKLFHDLQGLGIATSCRNRCLFAGSTFADEETAAAVIFIILVEIRDAADLPRPGIPPAVKMTVDHERSSDSSAESHTKSFPITCSPAETGDSQCEAVAIVVHRRGNMVPVLKLFLKMDLLPGRNSYDIIDYPLVGVNDRRDSYSDSIDFRGYQLINHAVDVIQHFLLTPSGAA